MTVTKEEVSPVAARQRGKAEADAFEKKYAEALEGARVSAEHTATEGWQSLYREQLKKTEKSRREVAELLRGCATMIERGDNSEGLAKSISETKKEYEEVCGQELMFQKQVLDPIKQPMHHCHEVIEQARREARQLESNSPLISKGVLETVEDAIEDVQKVSFDEVTGIIAIKRGDEK